MHVITKAIRSIVATVLENALSAIYVVLSFSANKGNNKITELRTILQRESPNS